MEQTRNRLNLIPRFFFTSLFIGSLFSFVHLNTIVVPNAHIGLLKEKAQGWDKEFLTEGYHWIWTYFIPLKWELYFVDLRPSTLRIKFQAPLKYSKYLQLSDVFDVQVEIKIQYNIDQNRIRSLLLSLDEKIDRLSGHIQERIAILLELKYLEYYHSEKEIPLLKAKLSNYIQKKIKKKSTDNSFFSDCQEIFEPDGIELIYVDLIKVYVPDLSLYRAQLANIGDIITARRNILLKNVATQAEMFALRQKDQLQIEKAKKILELIGKEPRILEYLKYQNLNPQTRVIRIETEKASPSHQRSTGLINDPENADVEEAQDQEFSSSDEIGQIGPLTK